MNVFDAVKSRRSIRAYRKGPVPQAALDDMLEAANWPVGRDYRLQPFSIGLRERRIFPGAVWRSYPERTAGGKGILYD